MHINWYDDVLTIYDSEGSITVPNDSPFSASNKGSNFFFSSSRPAIRTSLLIQSQLKYHNITSAIYIAEYMQLISHIRNAYATKTTTIFNAKLKNLLLRMFLKNDQRDIHKQTLSNHISIFSIKNSYNSRNLPISSNNY